MLAITQSRRFASENRETARPLKIHGRFRTVFNAGFAAALLLASAFYGPLHLGDAQFAVALIALVAVVTFVVSAVPYWQPILAHVRGASPRAVE